MATKNCAACADLQDYAPEFTLNGVTETVSTSLQNNTGFNPALTETHDNCSDLNDAADCLIGNLVDEMEAYDVCDWKEFMSKYVPNDYNTLKAIIAALCGVWQKVECMQAAALDFQTARMYTAKENVVFYDGFTLHNNAETSHTGVAVSYDNVHSYQWFDISNAKVQELLATNTYGRYTGIYGETISGMPVFRATGKWSKHKLYRIEETVGVTTLGSFTYMATISQNPNDEDEHTIYVSLRTRITDTFATEKADSIVLNMPANIEIGLSDC